MSKDTVHLTIRIEPEKRKELKLAALKNDTTITDIIINLIDNYLDKQ